MWWWSPDLAEARQRWLDTLKFDLPLALIGFSQWLDTVSEDKDGKNAWLGDPTQADNPFILVIGQFYEGHDPFAPAPHHPMGPFAHIGVELPSKEAVDEMAAKGKAGGCLAFGPTQMPKQIGYICFLKDPDGNTIEFSYDQGVFEKAREVWSKAATPA